MANRITLSGEIIEEPHYTHKCNGETFFEFTMKVFRKSGVADHILCTVSEILVNELKESKYVEVTGEIRSRNKKNGNLSVFVMVNSVREHGSYDINATKIHGFLCTKATIKETYSGRELSTFLVASHRNNNEQSDYIPCVAWGRDASRMANMPIGTEITLHGRLQSRKYVKTLDDADLLTREVHEVSVRRIDEKEDTDHDCT